jgi:hypothetical protein
MQLRFRDPEEGIECYRLGLDAIVCYNTQSDVGTAYAQRRYN